MRKTTQRKVFYFLIGLISLSLSSRIEAQVVIGAPSLEFTQACASESFNTFEISFIFAPENAVGPSNQFVVEMSDENGNFSDPAIVFTSISGAITVSPATVNFSLPTTTAGEGYKVRIKSTEPGAVSSASVAFPAYYKIHDTPFTINNLLPTGKYCPGSAYLLTIDNPGTGNNISPLLYPDLTFNWYKETSPTTSIFITEGSTLAVYTDGTYFVETNYGSCTSNSFSNRVTISEATTGQTANTIIESSLGNPFCLEQGPTTLSTMLGNSYAWYKDGTLIANANESTYQTEESGIYSVEVISGSCTAIGTIDLRSGDFTSSIDVPSVNMMEAGDTLVVTVSTTALNPEFEWYLDEELIADATGNIHNATEFGNYKVLVFQNSECLLSNELQFEISEQINQFPEVENIPNIVSPNGDGINDRWIVPTRYVNGTNTEVTIFSSQGKMVYQTKEYLNDWPQDQMNLSSVNQVFYYIIASSDQEIKKGSITVIK